MTRAVAVTDGDDEARQLAEAIATHADFGRFSAITQVGGDGALLAAILSHNEHLTGVLFDSPAEPTHVRQTLLDADVLPRCAIIDGDFFAAVPPGSDAYLLTDLWSDWDEDPAVIILRRCREAMTARCHLFLVDRCAWRYDSRYAGHTARRRDRAAIEPLCNRGGFRLVHRALPLGGAYELLTARPL